mmetsp:Transcript_4722/g.13937  ORF Transcript_4722/g.13937 Transcript_4722/m.13937 type:complete len:214 (+) Transcript_4722:2254-2895(+)
MAILMPAHMHKSLCTTVGRSGSPPGTNSQSTVHSSSSQDMNRLPATARAETLWWPRQFHSRWPEAVQSFTTPSSAPVRANCWITAQHRIGALCPRVVACAPDRAMLLQNGPSSMKCLTLWSSDLAGIHIMCRTVPPRPRRSSTMAAWDLCAGLKGHRNRWKVSSPLKSKFKLKLARGRSLPSIAIATAASLGSQIRVSAVVLSKIVGSGTPAA